MDQSDVAQDANLDSSGARSLKGGVGDVFEISPRCAVTPGLHDEASARNSTETLASLAWSAAL